MGDCFSREFSQDVTMQGSTESEIGVLYDMYQVSHVEAWVLAVLIFGVVDWEVRSLVLLSHFQQRVFCSGDENRCWQTWEYYIICVFKDFWLWGSTQQFWSVCQWFDHGYVLLLLIFRSFFSVTVKGGWNVFGFPMVFICFRRTSSIHLLTMLISRNPSCL